MFNAFRRRCNMSDIPSRHSAARSTRTILSVTRFFSRPDGESINSSAKVAETVKCRKLGETAAMDKPDRKARIFLLEPELQAAQERPERPSLTKIPRKTDSERSKRTIPAGVWWTLQKDDQLVHDCLRVLDCISYGCLGFRRSSSRGPTPQMTSPGMSRERREPEGTGARAVTQATAATRDGPSLSGDGDRSAAAAATTAVAARGALISPTGRGVIPYGSLIPRMGWVEQIKGRQLMSTCGYYSCWSPCSQLEVEATCGHQELQITVCLQ